MTGAPSFIVDALWKRYMERTSPHTPQTVTVISYALFTYKIKSVGSSRFLFLTVGSVAHTPSDANWPRREADLSPPASAKVKNAWSYTSTPS
jgi:hypothetical protein